MNQKLGIVEFEEVLLDNISNLVVDYTFIDKNKLYWESIVHDLFKYYYYSNDTIYIKDIAKTLESTISNAKVYKVKF